MLTNYFAACTHLSSTVSQLFEPEVQKSPFSRTAAHIFVSSGDIPATITQYVACVERQFNACQTPRSMYLSIFNSFRVIRCLSQCVTRKIAIFLPHFCFPWGRPSGNHAKCCINGKRIRCFFYFAACTYFNSFRVIRCLSQCVTRKIAIFLPHFCFPWGRSSGNHTKCCIDGKRIRCFFISLHVPIYLQQFPS